MSSHKGTTKPVAAIAVSLFALASAGKAAVVCDSVPPITIPATTAGVYVNLVTGVSAITPAGAPGWDFNPWSATLNFWFWNAADPSSAGGVAAATGGNILVLANGDTIDGARFYSDEQPASAEAAAWRATNIGQFLGIRFWNEGTAAINYGWMQIDTTATTGHPATIQSWCYEDSGAAITAGTIPVELQSFSVE